MRAPVRLNRSFWPSNLARVLPSAYDPRALLDKDLASGEFSGAVSSFKFGDTFKSTRRGRFPQSLEILSTLRYDKPPVVLDVGASDGITSLDVMSVIAFEKYFVTDLNADICAQTQDGATYFYTPDGECILIATDALIVYADTAGAWFPLGHIARRFFARRPALRPDANTLLLVNPELQSAGRSNVSLERYDILSQWPHAKVDLVIAANLLNRTYFSEVQLAQALDNLKGAMKECARLLVIDNRDLEKATLFRLSGSRAEVERQVNGGSEIESLALRTLESQHRHKAAAWPSPQH